MRQSDSRSSDERRPGARRVSATLALSMVMALSVFAAAQSLAESAQKEKERRDALKKSGAVIVTNTDLLKVKKRPSVTNSVEAIPAGIPGQAGASTVTAEDQARTEAAGLDAKPVISTGQAGAPPGAAGGAAVLTEEHPREVFDRKKADLEGKWNAARERMGLLEVRALGLRQQFGNPVNAAERDKAGKDIDALAPILTAARLEEKKAQEDLDKFLTGPAAPRK